MSTTAGTIAFWIWVTPFLLLILLLLGTGAYYFAGWLRGWVTDPDRFGRTKRYLRQLRKPRKLRKLYKQDIIMIAAMVWLIGGMFFVGFLEGHA